jgi:hypothetical protein
VTMTARYPMSTGNERDLKEGYDGPVFVWDIDKTYLSTNFSSLGGLLRIPLEFAVDKIANPGMPEVIRGLRRGPGEEYAGRLRDQVGFKVCALLAGRLARPNSREFLFGDDVEQDAAAFHLYARMINGDISPGDASTELRKCKVKGDDRKAAFTLFETLPRKLGRVERIFITLERNTPPGKFDQYGGMVVPVRGAGQLAFVLYGSGLIDAKAARQVIDAVMARSRSPEELVELLAEDALERKLISKAKLKSLELDFDRV